MLRESFSFLEGGVVVVFASLVADFLTSDKPSLRKVQVGHDERRGDEKLQCLLL